jgi:hypothetical protein
VGRFTLCKSTDQKEEYHHSNVTDQCNWFMANSVNEISPGNCDYEAENIQEEILHRTFKEFNKPVSQLSAD